MEEPGLVVNGTYVGRREETSDQSSRMTCASYPEAACMICVLIGRRVFGRFSDQLGGLAFTCRPHKRLIQEKFAILLFA